MGGPDEVYRQVLGWWLYAGPDRERRAAMATRTRRTPGATTQRKNYRIDVARLRRTQRILGTRTETETIHRALDLVVNQAELARAIRTFVRLGHGRLEKMDASQR